MQELLYSGNQRLINTQTLNLLTYLNNSIVANKIQNDKVKIEDRNYSTEEIKKCENNIATHIMSKSLKNMDLAKESVKYSSLTNIFARYEN